MREIRMLRAMWRALETESRSFLNGHEGGNAGYSQGTSYGFTRQRSTLPGMNSTQDNELTLLWQRGTSARPGAQKKSRAWQAALR